MKVEVHTLKSFPFWVPEPWECVGLAGMRRRGKSALLKAWVRYLLKVLPKRAPETGVVVFDLHDEHSVHGRAREDCQLGELPKRYTCAEFLAAVEGDDVAHLNREGLFVSLVPEDPDMRPADVAAQVRQVAPLLRDRGNVILIFEELGYWGEAAETLLHTVAACWGKEGIVPVFCGQAVTDTPERARKQWSKLLTAQQVKRHDLQFIKAQAGGAVALEIAKLPRLHYVAADLTQPAPETLEFLTS